MTERERDREKTRHIYSEGAFISVRIDVVRTPTSASQKLHERHRPESANIQQQEQRKEKRKSSVYRATDLHPTSQDGSIT